MRIRILAFTILICVSGSLFAQTSINIKLKSTKGFSSIKKDVEFIVDSVSFNPKYAPKSTGIVVANGKTFGTYIISISQAKKSSQIFAVDMPKNLEFKPVEDNLSNYWFAKNLASLKTISEIGNLYATRSDMEDDANRYIQTLARYGLVYDDPFLESYLYSIVSKILPTHRADGFPYDLKVVIVHDESMNASVFPNGYLLINTGLLAEMHTEDELVAALSHEIGHFVGNHALVNVRKMEKEAAKAEFWAAFATGIAAVAEGVASSYTGYYDGSLTYSTAILSSTAAYNALKRIGLDFSKDQEEEADQMALAALKYLGYDKNALATLFQRMTDAYNAEGNWAAYYLSGDHPSLEKRIEYSGTPYKRTDSNFEKKVSFAVTEAAIAKYANGRFTQALKHVSQNINNGVATDDDYLIKALCTLNLYSDASHNTEALSLVQRAKSINPNNVNILRTEIIASLRCNDNGKASILLDQYMNDLQDSMSTVANKESNSYSFLKSEYDWARKMAIKVKGL